MMNLDRVLKSRDKGLIVYYSADKGLIIKAMIFPVVMYGRESWAVKKAECQRIDAFELLEKTLESPMDRKEIKPVNLKGNRSLILIGGLLLKRKL